ncbi:unnamed protein product [Pleuronectes platessa]|uniref:1-alkyl-2-acetylglycerophosphocholine esterase n=1 Tax=Pleuronectes platessa TaxID=8262 RepID=A0A9N7UVT7_PLEPL|nr:unnamed protein product [Pleuronectes platessa]
MSATRGFVTVDEWTRPRESRKRHVCEDSQMGHRKKEPGRERAGIRLHGERRPRRHPVQRLSCTGNKWSFTEMTEDMECPQEMSPSPKRRRREAVKNTEAPRTEAPVKRRRWNLCYSKSSPDTKEKVTERKVSHKKIWIIGSSYIHRGEKAAFDCFGQNFGLDAKVEWFGKGGLRWNGVLPRFYSALSTQSPPDILVVHAGGNDLGLVPAKKLGVEMTRGLMQLHKDFPSMRILFSCINERQAWRYGEPEVINGDRRTVNEQMIRAGQYFGGEAVQHPRLRFFKRNLYLPDGVHFTQEGNHIFLSTIHGVLGKMLL